VAITVEPGRLWAQDPGGPRHEYEAFRGRVVFKRAPYTHWVGNIGASRVRIVHIESLAHGGSRPQLHALPTTHRTELENEVVRISRVAIARGATVPPFAYSCPVAVVTLDGGVRVGARLLSAGQLSWHADGRVPASVNAGEFDAELVAIEWRKHRAPAT
jgi:quercetin dioxygenase-like cupin family protein